MKINKKIKAGIILATFLIIVSILIFLNYSIKSQRLNVILITIDALRPDHLGCYGYQRNTSPNIDRIATEGTLFLNSIAQSSHTAPSLPSILTSTNPFTHKVSSFGDKMADPELALSFLFKTRGYKTGFFSSHGGIYSIRGFEDNFDAFTCFWEFGDFDNPKETQFIKINSKILKWINANKNNNFFLWVHYLGPHFPMLSPQRYKDMLTDYPVLKPEIKLPISQYITNGIGGIASGLYISNHHITNLNYYLNLYDAALRYTDEQIGNLVELLERNKLRDKTLIIISADHAEAIAEHNMYFAHGFTLYDELIKVPLIMKLPAAIPQGEIISEQVQLIDIAPTILEILGIKKPPGSEGISLVSLLKGLNSGKSRYAFSFLDTTKISVRTNTWKLIYDYATKQYELYNLKNDPKELTNLVASEKKLFCLLKSKLDSYTKQAKDNYDKEQKNILDENLKQKLRSLGYLQ